MDTIAPRQLDWATDEWNSPAEDVLFLLLYHNSNGYGFFCRIFTSLQHGRKKRFQPETPTLERKQKTTGPRGEDHKDAFHGPRA
jgi:hypothetical protein